MSDVQVYRCIECGSKMYASDELWCSLSCEDIWMNDPTRMPGHSLIDLDISTNKTEKRGRNSRTEKGLPPSNAYLEVDLEKLPF